MSGKPIDEAALTTVSFLDGGVVQMDRADYDRLTAAQQQGQARDCHCATCTCRPGMTPAVRFDTSPAAQEGAVRDHLIALGWTPPGAQQQGQAVAIEGTDAEVLREFIRICREHKPVGQWPGERVCAAIERSMANERPFRFIAEADMAPEREPSMKDADRALSGPRRNAAPPPSAPVGVEYAKQLAVALWRQHYRDDAPQWEPFDDLPGLLSQIDNMVSGLTRAPALAQQPAAVDGAMVDRFIRKYKELEPGDDVPAVDDPETRRFAETLLTAALATQHQEPTT